MKNLILLSLLSLSLTVHAANPSVSGTVELAPSLQKTFPSKGVLFIFARSAAQPEKGFPLAVKRIPDPKFPLSFSLSQSDAMVDGTEFSGAIKITARFSTTGDVMDKKNGFEGTIGEDQKLVVGKTKSVKVVISQPLGKK